MGTDINKKLIGLYFWLLILEGPLRKWFVPGLNEVLLIVRDPVLVLIYLNAIKDKKFPLNGHIFSAIALALVSILLCGIFAGLSPVVWGYGFRTLFLHIPLIYVLPQYWTRTDVILHGKWVMLLMIPQALLMVVQFGLPDTHRLNAGAGGSLGSQMEGAMGKIRPPGLFPFITGAAQFIPLVTVFVLHGLINRKLYPKWLIFLSALLILLALIVSISRLAIGSTLVVLSMLLIISLLVRSRKQKVLAKVLLPLILVGGVVSQFSIFEEGQEALLSRLERTGDLQVGVTGTAHNWYSRIADDLTGGLLSSSDVSLLGAGLGIGTNVGARYSTGVASFTLAEGEWGRVVAELGPLIGICVILLRISIAWVLFASAIRAIRRGNLLPILLCGASCLLIIMGQWGQSTTLGFAVWIGGLVLAACREEESYPA